MSKRTFLLFLLGLLTGCTAADEYMAQQQLQQLIESTSTKANAAKFPEVEPESYPGNLQPYGVEGGITDEQINQLNHLIWPQSYDAIKNLVGYPAYRDGQLDYYRNPNTGTLIAIEYDQQNNAIGYFYP